MRSFTAVIAIEMLNGAILYIKWHPVSKKLDEEVIHILSQKILEVIKDA